MPGRYGILPLQVRGQQTPSCPPLLTQSVVVLTRTRAWSPCRQTGDYATDLSVTGSRLRSRRPPCNLASRSEPPVRIELTASSVPRKRSTTELWRRDPASSPTVRKAAAGHVPGLVPRLLRTWYQTVCYYAQHSDGSTSGYAVTNPLSVSGDVRRASLLDMTGLPLSPRFRGIPWGLCMRLQRACCNTRRPRQARPPRDSLDGGCF